MYTLKHWIDGSWVAWCCTANPKYVNLFLDLHRVVYPNVPIIVDTPK